MELVGNVHLIAGTEADIPRALELLQAPDIATSRNPDLYIRAYRNFGIDEARDLTARAAARGFAGRRVFLIAADSYTIEAQNALLKTLEEPAGNALFLFLHPSPETFLSTLKSRAQMLALPDTDKGRSFVKKVQLVDPAAFLQATAQKRLDMLKPLLEKDNDEKRNIGAIINFLSALERSLGAHAQDAAARKEIAAVYRAQKYIGDRGALVKPLLESVALLI